MNVASLSSAAASQPAAPAAAEPPARPQVPPPTAQTWPKLDPNGVYVAQLATTDGTIGVQLLPGAGPVAAANFVYLARQGFYDHVPVHRMIPGFMFQSGDPTGTGTGGPGYNIKDDPVPVDMKYAKGTVAMANSGAPNSGGSQFFVMLGDVPLPTTYSIFGRVVSGMEVLDRIAATPVGDNGMGEVSRPLTPLEITGVTVSGPGI